MLDSDSGGDSSGDGDGSSGSSVGVSGRVNSLATGIIRVMGDVLERSERPDVAAVFTNLFSLVGMH